MHSLRKYIRVVSAFLLINFLYATFTPTISYALTSGPTAPEATSFEPIDTTDMAGLRAALDARVASLAVQGDSAMVLDALMYRRGINSKEVSVSYHKACQLLAAFEHVDFQFIPRCAG